jgi:methylated-DNA-[protein]-cysteine S-methyltransferase
MIELSQQRTPVGEVRIATRGETLVGLAFLDGWPRIERHLSRRFPNDEVHAADGAHEVARHLDAYMAGKVDALDGIHLDTGGTDFQRCVWTAIRGVPAGEVLAYAELALAAGAPNAVRAAGTACGANPIWLVVPCHRIVRADGDLGDYGGGIERKEWLLAHERRHAR